MTLKTHFNIESKSKSVQDQLFNQVLFIVLAISFLNIVMNQLIHFPFEANYKWFFMILLTFITIKYKDRYLWIPFSYITLIIGVILPIGWYNSGTNNFNVIAYIFISTIVVTFLFEEKKRLILVAILIIYFCLFTYLEYSHPELLIHYDSALTFFDRILQVPVIIIFAYIALRQFSNTFYQRNDLLKTLNMKLNTLAYTDALTQVHNRAYIFEKYENAIQKKQPFVSIMMDLDNFKHVNDNFGHLTGDQLLKELGQLLHGHFNQTGHVARYGGDEFIIMLNLDLHTVEFILVDFVNNFKNLAIVKETGATLSGGYGSYTHDSLDSHLRDIDIALYEAKKSGKNKILVTTSQTHELTDYKSYQN